MNLLQSSLWGGGGEEVANEGEKVENHRSEMEDKDSGDEPISIDEVATTNDVVEMKDDTPAAPGGSTAVVENDSLLDDVALSLTQVGRRITILMSLLLTLMMFL